MDLDETGFPNLEGLGIDSIKMITYLYDILNPNRY